MLVRKEYSSRCKSNDGGCFVCIAWRSGTKVLYKDCGRITDDYRSRVDTDVCVEFDESDWKVGEYWNVRALREVCTSDNRRVYNGEFSMRYKGAWQCDYDSETVVIGSKDKCLAFMNK